MASKGKQLRQALSDGTISKKETRTLRAAGVGRKRIKNAQARNEVTSSIGKKFGLKDLTKLQEAGFGNNRILKAAASTPTVRNKASKELFKINPGIKLPSKDAVDGNYGGTLEPFARFAGGIEARTNLTGVSKSLEGLKKNYYQWQGTTASGEPLALGGYKVPKGLRKGNPLAIGTKAMNRGTFTSGNGTGTLFGRDASSLLNNKGEMKNEMTSWRPRNLNTKPSGGGGSKGGGDNAGGGGGTSPGGGGNGGGGSTAPDPEPSPTKSGSGIFGGSGTETFGAPTFRRRRSRAQLNGSSTQGPSRLGINLQRRSGLNIMRA